MAGAIARSIQSVTILFDMSRHHENRLAQIHRFANRFETGGAGIRQTSRHLLEKCLVVERMKTERRINLLYLLFAPPVPKETERNVGTLSVPRHYILSKTRIEHVAVDVVSFCRMQGKDLFTQERRYHTDIAGRIVVHGLKRKRQFLASADARQARKEVEQPDFRPVSFPEAGNLYVETGIDGRYKSAAY